MSSTAHRRWFGLLLGALIGLAYTLVAELINPLVLPGIPLYRPPFGPPGNVAFGVLLGGLLGLVTAWSESGIWGVFLASVAGALVITLASLLPAAGPDLWFQAASLAIIFAPVAAFFSIGLMLLRWLINREDEAYRESLHWRPPARLPRIVRPALAVLLAAALGLTAMYNDLARAVTPRMHALIDAGRAAPSAAELPEPLRVETVRAFHLHAAQPYRLEWDRDAGNRFAIPRPNTSPSDQSTVIAHFADGYLLACVFPDREMQPRCKDFAPGELLE
jgi:hypothetical protein